MSVVLDDHRSAACEIRGTREKMPRWLKPLIARASAVIKAKPL
jgi:hypothetical protein